MSHTTRNDPQEGQILRSNDGMTNPVRDDNVLFEHVSQLIQENRTRVSAAVNAEMTLLYWQVGKILNSNYFEEGRQAYGSHLLENLSKQLTEAFGRGWSAHHLRQCMKLASVFPDEEILYALRTKLNWTSIRAVMYINDPLKRDFYIEMAKLNSWSTRVLQDRIKSMLYERTAISKKPEAIIEQDLALLREKGELTQDLVFRDPYLLDYLGLHDSYSEHDLEAAILVELQRFIIELGNDFAFLDRQKRITIDGEDYYIDLLFFHRRLRCLVALELKLGTFMAAYKGQMELYLRWLEKHEMAEGENTPVGLILCSGKNEEHIELLGLDGGSIRVAEYLTELPDMHVLEQKLRQSIEYARRRLEADGHGYE